MKDLFLNLLKDEDGQGMVEYAIIITGIALLCVGAVKFLGGSIGDQMETIGKEVKSEVNSKPIGGGD